MEVSIRNMMEENTSFYQMRIWSLCTHHVVPKELILIIRLVCRIQLPRQVGSIELASDYFIQPPQKKKRKEKSTNNRCLKMISWKVSCLEK
jgi:hypothetical protein